MAARSESWSRPAEPTVAALAVAISLAVFLGAWALLHRGFYTHAHVIDTPVYQRYGDAMARGQVPYRDFGVEYPPGALPTFVVPALGHSQPGDFHDYVRVFEALMWACGAAALALMGLGLHRLGAGGGRLLGALLFTALAPLALGTVVLSRFDLWPAALTAGALAALLSGRLRLGHGLLGVAIATKVYPAVLVPLALVHVWRVRGRREAVTCLGVLVAVLGVCFLPFVAIAPRGVWDSVVRQTTRPLQIESLSSGVLLALHHVFGVHVAWQSSHGSQNLVGKAPDVLGALQSGLAIAALLAIWALFARGPAGREELVRASAAAVCAFIALSKVLSPQYLIWLVPLVPLVRGRRGLAASALLGLALVLTQLWFPFRYWRLVFSFDPTVSWLVLARDLVLLALLVVLAWPERFADAGRPTLIP